jgi:hypothetical protein
MSKKKLKAKSYFRILSFSAKKTKKQPITEKKTTNLKIIDKKNRPCKRRFSSLNTQRLAMKIKMAKCKN